MVSPAVWVSRDSGKLQARCQRHRVAVGDFAGELFEDFDVERTKAGLADIFACLERRRARRNLGVGGAVVANKSTC